MDRLALKEIVKNYKTFRLNGVSFPIKEGFITGFIGPNGSGKTTTIRSILGLIRLDGGEISYQGKKVESFGYLDDVGVVLDETIFAKDWTVKDISNILSVGYSRWDEAEYFKRIRQYGIEEHKKIKDLSRGMNTKTMLAAALSHGARTLILDEPTSGLDPRSRADFRETIQSYMAENEENTVLFSTHITQDLETIADYIAFMMDGELVFYGTKEDFLSTYVVVKCKKEPANIAVKIYGKKVSDTYVELLVSKKDAESFGEGSVVEAASIDRVMCLYKQGDEIDEG